MSDGYHPSNVVAKVSAYIVAWLASWTLGEVQQAAGIFSALAIGFVALVNGYISWRRYRASARSEE